MSTTITAQEFVHELRRLVGTPFVHQGRTTDGVDCIGAIGTAVNARGVDIASLMGVSPNTRIVYTQAATGLLYDTVKKYCKPVSQLAPGVAILFKMPRAAHPYHFAVFTERNTIIHAESFRVKKVVEQGWGEPWKRMTHSMWEVPGVVY
jgi:cell wall-associated NlpC family hydrolase